MKGSASKCARDSSLFERIVGSSNEGEISVNGLKTSGLIDTGYMITSVSEQFNNSMDPVPELHDLDEFGLSVQGATGKELPFKGCVEAEISVPFLSDSVFNIPLLVVPETEYNSKVPVIIRTNLIRLCKTDSSDSEVPVEWQTAFNCLTGDSIPVKTTNNYAIRIGPNEVRTIHGIARKSSDFETVVTEHVESSLSGNLNICPRVFSLKSSGNTVRVPVRVCNLSARAIDIPPRSLLCTPNSVSVLEAWTPDPSQKSGNMSSVKTFEELGVSIDTDNLSADQLLRVRQVLGNWSHIFSTGPTDLGKSREKNPQKLTQLSSRSHPRHLVGKKKAQKDTIIDITSDSQVNSNFPYRWSPASLTFNNYFYLFLYLYIT